MQNAIIESTMLGFEDRGIFTYMIYVNLSDGGTQGFGGYVLGGDYTNKVIKGILNAAGVDSWEKLKGRHVRVKKEGYHGRLEAIGHIMEDKWFDPAKAVEA